jgi:FlaA1/EpsC-like NDP-sugar epimerase
MIHLSGRSVRDEQNPDGDIAIEFTGLRPGEKLYEELLIDSTALPTPHPKIMRSLEAGITGCNLAQPLADLARAVERRDCAGVKEVLSRVVEGYQPLASGEGPAIAAE